MTITEKTGSGKPTIDISGPSGNAVALVGAARRYSRQLGMDAAIIINEMMEGDYEHLVATFDKHFGDYVDLVR